MCEVALKCNKESNILIYQVMALCPYDRENWSEITLLQELKEILRGKNYNKSVF